MKDEYLYEMERNLELQAAGFLLQKESLLLKSQIRAEQIQQSVLDRLRALINKQLTIIISNSQPITGILKEVAADHICLENSHREIIIPITSISLIKDLTRSTQTASVIQSKWNMNSLLRSFQLEQKNILISLTGNDFHKGCINSVYQDHFDLSENNQNSSIMIQSIRYISVDKDLDEI